MFITFEGPEGSGKSTQIDLLSAKLEKAGREYIKTFEPGGTVLGKNIRKLLLDMDNMSERAELFLYAADRAEHVRTVIEPSLNQGKIVISDRYYHSTLAYQGYGRKINVELIKQIMKLAVLDCEPDIVILMDIEVEEGMKRIMKSGRKKDRIENEKIEFHKRVRNGYLSLAENESEKFFVVDASLPPDEIHNLIWEKLKKCL